MPIYAYKCSACGHAEDKLQKISDSPLTVCPQCGQSTYSKQVTAAGFQLKGSGWYVTDFRSNGSGGAKTSEAAVPIAGSEAATGGDAKASSGDSSASQSGSSSDSSGNTSSGAASSGSSNSSASNGSSSAAPASGSGASGSSGGSPSNSSGNT